MLPYDASTQLNCHLICWCAPPLPILERWDLICCNNPSSFFLRQFVKPQHLLQQFGNTETKQVHSIISPWVADFLISLFCSIFRENALFPASAVLSAAETPWQQVRDTLKNSNLPQPSLFCFFEVLFAFADTLRPECILWELSNCTNHYISWTHTLHARNGTSFPIKWILAS